SVFPPRHARTSAGKDRTVHPLRFRLPLRPEADRSFGSGFVLRHRKHPINMNHGLSILFRAIPLLMAAFCFSYGAYIYGAGDDPARLTAGPVVFFLGSI